MDFNDRDAAGAQSVMHGDRCVCIGAGIEYEGAGFSGCFLYPVDKIAFMIGLPEDYFMCASTPDQGRLDVGKSFGTIYFRLTCAQQIEIGAIENIYGFGHAQRSCDWMSRICAVMRGKASLIGDHIRRAAMQITLNGEPREIVPGMTVLDLITTLGPDPRGIAVERNLEIVPKSAHGETELADGDRLEIVRFVGGG